MMGGHTAKAKAKAMLGRCGYASGGAASVIGRLRTTPEDWTDNNDRARPKLGNTDQRIDIKPSWTGTDRAMDKVTGADLLGADGGEPLRHGRGAYAAGGKVSDAMQDKAAIAKAVHRHERADHPGTPLTKLRRGGTTKGH